MARSLLAIAGVLLLGYGLYLALLWTQQRSMMFPGAGLAGRAGADSARLPERAMPVGLAPGFGEVQAVFIAAPPGQAALATLVYFHGNAESVAQNLRPFAQISDDGFHVLLVGYPGYAGNDGRPSRETLMQVARAGHDWLRQHPAVDPERIMAVGRSVGSGPATELAAERELAALVLLSPFTSVAAFARQFGAPAFLVRDRFDNLARFEQFSGPILIFHGRRDAIIPYTHGQALAQASPRATLVTLACGHNDCPYFDPAFRRELQTFAHAALPNVDE